MTAENILFSESDLFENLLAIIYHYLPVIYNKATQKDASLYVELHTAVHNKVWEDYRLHEKIYDENDRERMIKDFIKKIKESCPITGGK